MPNELSEIALHLAGETGQVGLAWSAGVVGMEASVDQHAADVRDALAGHSLAGPGRRVTPAMLLEYAQGFLEAAVARGWWPPHRRAGGAPGGPDWESLRLAAVCRLVMEAERALERVTGWGFPQILRETPPGKGYWPAGGSGQPVLAGPDPVGPDARVAGAPSSASTSRPDT